MWILPSFYFKILIKKGLFDDIGRFRRDMAAIETEKNELESRLVDLRKELATTERESQVWIKNTWLFLSNNFCLNQNIYQFSVQF